MSANCGVEPGKVVKYKPLLDGALQLISFRPHKCIIYNRPGVRDIERFRTQILKVFRLEFHAFTGHDFILSALDYHTFLCSLNFTV